MLWEMTNWFLPPLHPKKSWRRRRRRRRKPSPFFFRRERAEKSFLRSKTRELGGDGDDLQKPSNPFPSPSPTSPVATIFLQFFLLFLFFIRGRRRRKKLLSSIFGDQGSLFLHRGEEKREAIQASPSLPPLSISLPTIPPSPSFRTKYWGRARNKTSPLLGIYCLAVAAAISRGVFVFIKDSVRELHFWGVGDEI